MAEGFVKVLLVLRWRVNAVSVAEVSVQLTLIRVGETALVTIEVGWAGGSIRVVAVATPAADRPNSFVALTRY